MRSENLLSTMENHLRLLLFYHDLLLRNKFVLLMDEIWEHLSTTRARGAESNKRLEEMCRQMHADRDIRV